MFLTAPTAVSSLSSAMGTAATTIEGLISTAVDSAIPIAATVLAITVGWRVFRNFTHG